jgi:PAS domain S-box-containing protein
MKEQRDPARRWGTAYATLAFAAVMLAAAVWLKQAFDRLRRSEETWKRSFDAASEGIFILDKDLTVIRHNRALAELLGKRPEEIIGKKCYELMHGADRQLESCVTCSAAEGRSAEAEFFEPFLGRHIYASADATRDDRGNVELIMHTVRDITAQKEAEQKVRDGLAFRQTILDTIPNPVFYKNEKGVYIGCNKAFAELVAGLPREEVVGKTPFDIASPELARVYHEKDMEMVENPGVQVYESQVRFTDGALHDVMFNKAAYLKPDGSVAGIVGVMLDITERKRAEERIREAEKRYRELAESLPQTLYETDARGTLTYVNETALRMFGTTRESVVNVVNVLEVVVEEDRQRLSATIEGMAAGRGGEMESEYLARRSDGTTFPCIVYSSPILDDEGNMVGSRGLLADISERKAYENELERLNIELEGYAHTVSHDLKNPIAKIAMAFELLEEGLEEPTPGPGARESMTEAIGIGKQSVTRTVDLIDDLLLLAEAGEPRDVEPVDVGKTVGEILSEKVTEIKEKGVKVEVDPDLGTVYASPIHVYQVFVNLVRNSLQHNTGRNPYLEIHRLSSGEGEHRFLVKDNGPGIPEDLSRLVFLPFAKGADTGSTGIGLSIVAKIIDTYGGEIETYNDGGACFEFTLRDYPAGPVSSSP